MEKKHISDTRRFKLDTIMKKDYIPFLEGRPKREKVILQEDIDNLLIALNASKSFEEFIDNN